MDNHHLWYVNHLQMGHSPRLYSITRGFLGNQNSNHRFLNIVFRLSSGKWRSPFCWYSPRMTRRDSFGAWISAGCPVGKYKKQVSTLCRPHPHQPVVKCSRITRTWEIMGIYCTTCWEVHSFLDVFFWSILTQDTLKTPNMGPLSRRLSESVFRWILKLIVTSGWWSWGDAELIFFLPTSHGLFTL